LQELFPLLLQEDFESYLNNAHYIIGINDDYPAELLNMVSAAVITFALGNKSIDHVKKHHLKNISSRENRFEDTRIDREIRLNCINLIKKLREFSLEYPDKIQRDPRIGEWIADFTFTRVPYSIVRAFSEGDRGALYESVVISRMILEQVAWSHSIRELDDFNKIQRISVTRSIGKLNGKFPGVGKLYGWMSSHAHWSFEAHFKAITIKEDKNATMLASCTFKYESYLLLIVLTKIIADVFLEALNEYREVIDFECAEKLVAEYDPVAIINGIEIEDETHDLVLSQFLKMANEICAND